EFNHGASADPSMSRPDSTTEAARALARLPLFEGVDARTLEETAAHTTWRELKKRQQVLSKGAVGDHLLFLASGRLQVLDVTESGREIGLNLLMPGDYFGELSIIDGQPRSASVVAIENSVVALVPKAQAWQLFRHNP